MKDWRIIIIYFAISFIGFLLMSCTVLPEPKVRQSFCAGASVLAIVVWGKDYPVRGRTCNLDGEYHIQIEYLPDEKGSWVPLEVFCLENKKWPGVKEGKIEGEKKYKDQIYNELEYYTGQDVLWKYLLGLKEIPEGRLNH